MRQGDTFLNLAAPELGDPHLWVVLSDAARDPAKVVIVMVASWDSGSGDSCIFEAGEHPFFRHNSYAVYESCLIVPTERLRRMLDAGRLKPKEPFSAAALAKLLEGAGESRRIRSAQRQVLEDQGLID